MKSGATTIVVFAACLASVAAHAAEKPETLAELKSRAAAVRPEESVRLCASVARRALEEAREQYAKGADEEGKALLLDVASYSERATDAATHVKKHEKQLEIDLRDISHHLEALKREVALEDQAAVETAMMRLEKLRTRLLQSMFGKGRP